MAPRGSWASPPPRRWARRGSTCLTLVRGDESGGATLPVEILQLGGWHGQLNMRTRDGRTKWLRAHIQPITRPEFDGKPGVAAMFWDGEGPDRAVSGPAAAQLPYRDLFVHSPDALFLANLDSVIVDANERAAALLGTSREELLGKRLVGFLVGRTDADTDSAREELLASGSIVRRVPVQPASGDPFPAEIIVSLATSVAGGYGYSLVRLSDRTQEEHLEAMLRNLAALARPGDQQLEAEEVAQRALEIIAATWAAGAAVAILESADGFSIVAGTSTPEAIRATLSGVDPARSPLALLVKDAQAPFEMDLGDPRAPPLGRTGQGPGAVHPAGHAALVRRSPHRGDGPALGGRSAARPRPGSPRAERAVRSGLAIGSVATRLKHAARRRAAGEPGGIGPHRRCGRRADDRRDRDDGRERAGHGRQPRGRAPVRPGGGRGRRPPRR